MTEPVGTLPRLASAAGRALDRLAGDVATPESTLALLRELGVALPRAPQSLLGLTPRLGAVATRAASLSQAIQTHGEDSSEALAAVGALTDALGQAFGAIAAVTSGLPNDLAQFPEVLARIDVADLALRLLHHVLLDALAAEQPAVYDALVLLGAIEVETVAPDEEDEVTVPHTRRRLRLDRLGVLVRDPGQLVADLYGWGSDDLDHPALLERAGYLLRALGLPADLVAAPSVLGALGGTAALEVPLYRETTEDGTLALAAALAAVGAPGELPPPGLVTGLVAEGQAGTAFALAEGIELTVALALAGGAPLALEIRPGEAVRLRLGGVDVSGTATLTRRRAEGGRQVLLAAGSWLLLDTDALRFAVGVHAAASAGGAGTASLQGMVEAGVLGAALRLGGGQADGFIQRMLPPDGVTIPFEVLLRWRSGHGLELAGGVGGAAELAVKVPLDVSLFGVVEIAEIDLVLRKVPDHGFAARATVDVGVRIGPVAGTIEQIGVVVSADPSAPTRNFGIADVGLDFAFPRGLGVRVAAGPVTGGGYLFFDPDEGQYAGALQLSVKMLSLTAVGLLTTKLPDGRPGFSLLLIITAEFPPIQLGYGFTLNGVGGLVGINRTMVVEALRDGVRDRSLESILFPRDPVANASRVISDLRRVFPPAEGRFTFGPMARLGWGPNALIDIQLALVLELPSPLRLAILGRLQVALPSREEAVVDLRLDVVGILDFDRSEASVDASLVDSRLAGFELTGDMAFRLGWGATKTFAMSAGGFNPRFAAPAGFPVLRRLGIALASGENPRLRLESYFALTSNTIQFGARADLYAAYDTFVGRFSAAAYIGFDTLVQLDPFHFTADLCAGVEVARNGDPFLLAQLAATLDGPSPWRASGYVEVVFLGRHRIAFEATVGEAATEPVRQVDVAELLTAELERPQVWVATPPADAGGIATVRDATPSGSSGTADVVAIHPLGGVAVHQRLLPFGKRIGRFGAAVPVGGAQRYDLGVLRVGTEAAPPLPLLDDFAPAQYDNLADDQRLARPAFEPMVAGGSAALSGLAAVALPAVPTGGGPPGVLIEPGYTEVIVDDGAVPAGPESPAGPGGLVGPTGPRGPRGSGRPVRWVRRGSALPDAVHTAFRRHGDAGSTGSASLAGLATTADPSGPGGPGGQRIGVLPERYVLAFADTLTAFVEAGEGSSAAEAYDALARLGNPPDLVVVDAREAD